METEELANPSNLVLVRSIVLYSAITGAAVMFSISMVMTRPIGLSSIWKSLKYGIYCGLLSGTGVAVVIAAIS